MSRVLREGPLSHTQEQLWFLTRLDPASAFYNVPVRWRVSGRFDVAAMRNAVRELAARQAALRTRFAEGPDGPLQLVTDEADVPFTVHDAPDTAAADAQAQETSERPFDLASEVARVAVIRLGSEEAVLVLVLHHIICDGWSMEIVFSELLRAYADTTSGARPELTLQEPIFLEYALWQRKRLSGERRDVLVDFWRNHLSDAPAAITLPVDFARPEMPTSAGARLPCELTQQTSARVVQLTATHRSTPFMTLLACLGVTLAQLSGQSQVVIGTPVANRNRRVDQDVVGYYADTLCIHIPVPRQTPFESYLVDVRRTVLDCFRHRELPFGLLVRELSPSRGAVNPLFQVMFALQNIPRRPRPDLGHETTYSVLPDDRPTSIFDLRLDLTQSERGFAGFWEYSTALFTAERAASMLVHFQHVVAQAVACPETPLGQLGSPALTPSGFNDDLET